MNGVEPFAYLRDVLERMVDSFASMADRPSPIVSGRRPIRE